MALTVEIVGPDAVLWSGQAKSVSAPSVEGSIGLRPQHEPILSVLRDGEVVVVDLNDEHTSIHVGGGFLSFDHDSVTVVVDGTAERTDA